MANDPGAAEKKPVRVTIHNQTFTLLSSGDQSEVEELAHVVDELISSIVSRSGNVDTSRAAVLACLHLADQLRGSQKELAGIRERIDNKSREFALLLDQTLLGK